MRSREDVWVEVGSHLESLGADSGWGLKLDHRRSATSSRGVAGKFSFRLLNEPPIQRAKVLALIDAWFDRWLT